MSSHGKRASATQEISFPRFAALYNWLMARPLVRRWFDPLRREIIGQAHGVVLEVGAGGGQNFPFYDPTRVERVEAVEPDEAMLIEARRRAAVGQRVIVGWLEQNQRPDTMAQLGELEMIAPAPVVYRGHRFDELDVARVLATKPDAVVVDELAHGLPDGSRKRWMDVAQLIDSGIDALTTVNVASLVSTRDYLSLTPNWRH